MRRRSTGRSRRILLIGISAAVVAVAAVVTPQAFAGTLPGFGGGARKAGGGLGPGAINSSGLNNGRFTGAGPAAGTRAGSLLQRARNRQAQGGATGGAASGGAASGATGGQNAAGCSDVELVFARGTGEPQGLGIVGQPLAKALAAELPDRSVGSFAVVYAAASDQASAGPGATNMSQHVEQVAQSCPDTQFVIGGYSQGASVTDIAMGIQGAGTPGDAIAADLTSRVAAVVVFGNPLGLRRQTIAQASPDFGAKAVEFCNTGDPVCGNGNNFAAHLAYPRNGTVPKGAQFAAQKIGG